MEEAAQMSLRIPFCPRRAESGSRSGFTLRAPLLALEASTRSAVSFRSRWLCRSSTSMYSRACSFSIFSFFSRST